MSENNTQPVAAAQPGSNSATPAVSIAPACHRATDMLRNDAGPSSSLSGYGGRLPGIFGNTSDFSTALARQQTAPLREMHPDSSRQPSALLNMPEGSLIQPALGSSAPGSSAVPLVLPGSAIGGVHGIGAMQPMPAAWAAIHRVQQQQQLQHQQQQQQQSTHQPVRTPVLESNGLFPSASTVPATVVAPAPPASSAQPEQQSTINDAQSTGGTSNRTTTSRQATGTRGPQLKWTVAQQVAIMKQANASSEDRQKEKKEVVWKRDAELLRGHEAFNDFVSKGGDLSYTKIRDKYTTLLKTAKDKDRRAQWESGIREDDWAAELISEVDQALGTEEDIREQREMAAAGRVMVVERQERQGQEVVDAAMGGRDCTALVLRPSPSKGKNARSRADPTEAPVDLSNSMSVWIQHKIEGSVADSQLSEKKHDLQRSKFDFEKQRQQNAEEDANKRTLAEANRDEKRMKMEDKRFDAEIEVRKDELEIRQDEMRLANKREDNRAAEAKEQGRLAAQNQKQQTEMMLSLMKVFAEKK